MDKISSVNPDSQSRDNDGADAAHAAVSGKQPHSPFPIVGIGASAGGLGAFSQLLSALPEQTGMALIVVSHLDPRHESMLSQLLARQTRIPVLEGTHGAVIRPDHVYVIPPNTNLAIADGLLYLTPRAQGHATHLPVDHLFRSLAEVQQMRAIGVVLSGTGSDGTLGLAEIKAVGGITFAQDERTAVPSRHATQRDPSRLCGLCLDAGSDRPATRRDRCSRLFHPGGS